MARKYTDEDIQDLAASYALGTLSEEEKAEFDAVLQADSRARAYLEYFKEIIEELAYNTEPLQEPEGLEKRLFLRLLKRK